MKCHKCGRKATFHITEMIDAQKVELHLCDEHANEYLHQHDIFANDSNDDSTKDLQETTDSLMLDDFQTCPCCGAIARTTKVFKLICGECMEPMERAD